MINGQEKKNYNNAFYKKVQKIAEKSTWKKELKEKVISKVKKRMSEETT